MFYNLKNSIIKSRNPSDGFKVIGETKNSKILEIELAVSKARSALNLWEVTTIKNRISHLAILLDIFIQNKEKIIDLLILEMGYTYKYASRYDFEKGIDAFRWYLANIEFALEKKHLTDKYGNMHTYVYQPLGVSAVIVPWNTPFYSWVSGVISNLSVGNTVVFKHAEECLLFSKYIESLCHQAGLPEGVVNHIYGSGDVGELLTNQEIDLIYFSGNDNVAKKIYRKAGDRFIRCIIETGGSAPGIVFDDVDLDKVVKLVYKYRFQNSGQMFDGLKRLIIHKYKVLQFIQKMQQYLDTIKFGNPMDHEVDIGPVVSDRQFSKAKDQLSDALNKGAKKIYEKQIDKDLVGGYFPPTILTEVNVNMRIWFEEVLAPILPIVEFTDEKEALELANYSDFGSGGYIFTKDNVRAHRVALKLKTGMISVNGGEYKLPFNYYGGVKKSGIGRKHGLKGLEELCNVKLISQTL